MKPLAAPVRVPLSTRCAPSVPLTMVALTPGLSLALLIASRIDASEPWLPSTERFMAWPPTVMVRVPVPIWVLLSVNAPDDALRALASWVTSIL